MQDESGPGTIPQPLAGAQVAPERLEMRAMLGVNYWETKVEKYTTWESNAKINGLKGGRKRRV
jgi:V8-like Glu-specific endopeptidase